MESLPDGELIVMRAESVTRQGVRWLGHKSSSKVPTLPRVMAPTIMLIEKALENE